MVISASGDKRGLVTHPLLQLKTKDAAPEFERSLDIGNLEVDVTDVDARVNREI
jgi:hypothetical protein